MGPVAESFFCSRTSLFKPSSPRAGSREPTPTPGKKGSPGRLSFSLFPWVAIFVIAWGARTDGGWRGRAAAGCVQAENRPPARKQLALCKHNTQGGLGTVHTAWFELGKKILRKMHCNMYANIQLEGILLIQLKTEEPKTRSNDQRIT